MKTRRITSILTAFIIIIGICFVVQADAVDEPVFYFELEDGTQILTQDNVIKASLVNGTDSLGNQEYIIEITFDEEGKEAFREATTAHVGEEIRIVVNGETVSAPRVQEPISNGKCVITGVFTMSEAEQLIRMLDPEAAAAYADETEAQESAEDVLLSGEDAYNSVYDYIDETLGVRTINMYYGYIVPEYVTDEEYVIKVKSYTSAIGYYYVNKYTGDVYSAWTNPVTDELDDREYEYTIDEQELERLHTQETESEKPVPG